MQVEVTCECGNHFRVPEHLTGGITNCPECGKATSVEGLRDGMWNVLRVLALVLLVAAVWLSYAYFGQQTALVVGVGLALIYALILLVS